MKIDPSSCSGQKLITLRVVLCDIQRTRRSALALILFLALWSFLHLREYSLHLDCFFASLPSCLDRCLFRDRMPRPVTIIASPILVETVAKWISPRSTVA